MLVVILTIKVPIYPALFLLGLVGLVRSGRRGGRAARVFLITTIAGALLGPLSPGSTLSVLVAIFTGTATYAATTALRRFASLPTNGPHP